MTRPRYYFLEAWDPELAKESAIFVSFNPEVSYRLTELKIPYRVMEDFYSEKELRLSEDAFFLDQLQWLKRMDAYIQQHSSFCARRGIELARLSYNRIKYFIDSAIIQAFITRAIIEKMESDAEIIFVTKARPDNAKVTLLDLKFDESITFFQPLFQIACKSKKISMRSQFLSDKGSLLPNSANKAASPKFKDLIKKVAPETVLTSLNLTFKYRNNNWVLPEIRDAKGLKVLFVHSSGIHLEPVVQAFLRAGADVFVCNGSYIYEMNAILGLGKPVMNLAGALTPHASILEREFCAMAQNFLNEGQDWLPWIDQKAGIPMMELVAPFFESFFKQTCTQILIKAESLQIFYERFQIDFIVTHTSSDSFAKSALVAAALHPRVKSVCIQHCCDVFEDKVMEMTDIDPFDVHFATDSLSQIRFRQYAQKEYVKPAQVFQSPHFLINVAAYAKKGTAQARKKRVLYLPTKLTVHTRYFNCMVYPITWYFEYQKELLNFFNQQDFQFIYKHQVRNKKYTENSLIPYIEARGYKNITVETAPMMTYFQSVDAIIMDRPTTALYEAAMSGVPTLALYPDMIDGLISKEAVDFFGKGVQRFSSNQEAFAKIEEFLNSGPEDFRTKAPLRDDGIVTTLNQLRHIKKGSDAKAYFLKATV